MKRVLVLVCLFLAGAFACPCRAQTIQDADMDTAIKTEQDADQKRLLEQFRERFGPDDSFQVTERGGQYEIIVSHPSQDGWTGGAEQYFLDKETGETRLGWHEHPMPRN